MECAGNFSEKEASFKCGKQNPDGAVHRRRKLAPRRGPGRKVDECHGGGTIQSDLTRDLGRKKGEDVRVEARRY